MPRANRYLFKLLRLQSGKPPGKWVRRWVSVEMQAGNRYIFDLEQLGAN